MQKSDGGGRGERVVGLIYISRRVRGKKQKENKK